MKIIDNINELLRDDLKRTIKEEDAGIRAIKAASRIAEERGISDMTLEEINAEISRARRIEA